MTLDLWLQPVTEQSVDWAEGHAGVLDPDERTRWKRFYQEESQDLFVVAHVSTRFVLSEYAEVAPRDWSYVRGDNGRPELNGGPAGLRFNISHTDGMAVVLVHGEEDAGVDVESPWRSTDIESVSKRVFTEDERAAMLALPAEDQAARFYQLWTLKESFIKAKGKGFAMPLSKFGFGIGVDGSIGFRCDPSLDSDASRWRFSTTWAETGHVVSVCAQGAPTTTHPSVLSLQMPRNEPLPGQNKGLGGSAG